MSHEGRTVENTSPGSLINITCSHAVGATVKQRDVHAQKSAWTHASLVKCQIYHQEKVEVLETRAASVWCAECLFPFIPSNILSYFWQSPENERELAFMPCRCGSVHLGGESDNTVAVT